MGLFGAVKKFFQPQNIKVMAYGMEFDVSLGRFSHHLKKAQKALNTQVLSDCTKFIPIRSGTLRGSGYFPEGEEGQSIGWDTPYAHYQHEGILYVSELTGSAFSSGEKKIPADPTVKLTYSMPGTGDHWFTKAKEAYGDEWVRMVRKIAGGRKK